MDRERDLNFVGGCTGGFARSEGPCSSNFYLAISSVDMLFLNQRLNCGSSLLRLIVDNIYNTLPLQQELSENLVT